VLTQETVSPSQLRARVGHIRPQLTAWVMRALEKNRDNAYSRWPNSSMIWNDCWPGFDGRVGGTTAGARRQRPPGIACAGRWRLWACWRWARRSPWLWQAAVSLSRRKLRGAGAGQAARRRRRRGCACGSIRPRHLPQPAPTGIERGRRVAKPHRPRASTAAAHPALSVNEQEVEGRRHRRAFALPK